MKYQIILESEEIFADDEFRKLCDQEFNAGILYRFKLIEARSLEGIREEVWKRKEEIKSSNGTETREEWNEKVDEVFEDLSDLFKLT